MRPSRGMGIMRASKLPKTAVRKDSPNKLAKGGAIDTRKRFFRRIKGKKTNDDV